jgi:hypothetical protein
MRRFDQSGREKGFERSKTMKSETKVATHTPGPWTASHPTAEGVVHINSRAWGWLATVVTMTQAEYHNAPLLPSPEGEANARLIALAPEMLDMLKDARANLWQQYMSAGGDEEANGNPLLKRDSKIIEKIDALIVKAEPR